MAQARNDFYPGIAAGTKTVRLGRQAPPEPMIWDSLEYEDLPYGATAAQMQGHPLIVNLHGSSGANYTTGRHYYAGVSGPMAYDTYTTYEFSVVAAENTATGEKTYSVRPIDVYGSYPSGVLRESYFTGFQNIPGPEVKLISERRLTALMEWGKNYFKHDPTRVYMIGTSLGARACLTYGMRRPEIFAAIYVIKGRWFHSGDANVLVPVWNSGYVTVPAASSPLVAEEDGGGTLYDRINPIQYLSNANNKAPWIGWTVGRNDTTIPWAGNLEAVDILRATGRPFAFYWNNGDHSTGPGSDKLLQSYKWGTFILGKGQPLFTEHSGDSDPHDPAVLEGGINIGLTFRNVVESSSAWSCEVTSVLGPRTVKVKPCNSEVFTANVESKLVTIPAANTWVPVSFNP